MIEIGSKVIFRNLPKFCRFVQVGCLDGWMKGCLSCVLCFFFLIFSLTMYGSVPWEGEGKLATCVFLPVAGRKCVGGGTSRHIRTYTCVHIHTHGQDSFWRRPCWGAASVDTGPDIQSAGGSPLLERIKLLYKERPSTIYTTKHTWHLALPLPIYCLINQGNASWAIMYRQRFF